MGQYDFTYVFPADFDKRIVQILKQKPAGTQLAAAFKSCVYEYEDLGFAHYAGVAGDGLKTLKAIAMKTGLISTLIHSYNNTKKLE